MTPQEIRLQLRDIYARLLSANLSVKQNFRQIRYSLLGGICLSIQPTFPS